MASTSNIPHYPDMLIKFDNQDDMIKGAFDLVEKVRPNWKRSDFKVKLFTEGITNVLVGVYTNDKNDMVLIRLYGNNTDQIIDRKAELRNMKMFKDYNCGATIYATFSNGLAYAYVPGNILTVETVRDPKIKQLVIEMMAKMHKMKVDDQAEPKPGLWSLLKCLFKASPDVNAFDDDPIKKKRMEECQIMPKSKIWEELCELESKLSSEDCPIVFAHNDLLLANIIHNAAENKVTFIDYEYGDYNYMAFDIANHFAEYVGTDYTTYEKYYPDEAYQKDWIKRYLAAYHNKKADEVSDGDVHKLFVQVQKFALCANFMWGIWGLVQAKNSSIGFDFFKYAMERFDEYKKKKDQFLSMK